MYLSDIDFQEKIIRIRRTLTRDENDKTVMGDTTKTYNSLRDIQINDQIEYILKTYLKEAFIDNKYDLLFYNPKHIYYSTGECNMVFKRFCEHFDIALGYDGNQHQLRHSFATRCIEAGMSANVVQKIMGHGDIKTTLDVYTDVFAYYEKKHSNQALEYMRQNDLLLVDKDRANMKKIVSLAKVLENMYKKQDPKIIEILKLLPKDIAI